jgi:N6-L-threonylcarbamoyladenine synthase
VAEHPPQSRSELADLCASFQGVVTRTLVRKTVRQARRLGIERVVVAGGVAANGELRREMARACADRDIGLFVPPLRSCTDNAAMIAYAGAVKLAAGARDDDSLGPVPTTSLPRVTRKGRGKRRPTAS